MSDPALIAIKNQASQWHALVHSGQVSDQDLGRFKTWLREDPRHADAFRELETLWRLMAFSAPVEEALSQARSNVANAENNAQLNPSSTKRLIAALGAIAALLMLAPGLGVFWFYAPVEIHETQIGEIRELTLSDGSSATLGGATRLRTRMSRLRRHVALEAGEAVFDVTPDQGRAFVVDAALAQVRVTGTVFEVSRSHHDVEVRVSEGAVRVRSAGQASIVSAGSGIEASANRGLGEVGPLTSGEFASWRERHFTFQQAPLSEVVETLNRYHSTPLRIQDPDLAALPMTLSFGFDQVNEMIAVLDISYGIQARPAADGALVLSAAR